MRVTVLGKSPSWQDAGGACSGYLIERDGVRLLLDCGNGVFSKLRSAVDYGSVSEVVISHLHADHFLDLIPFSYALANAKRTGRDPRPPTLHLPSGGGERLREITSQWGSPELVQDAFSISEYTADAQLQLGALQVSFCEVPHYVRAHAVALSADSTRFVFGADCAPNDALASFARGADLLMLEATLAAPEQGPGRGHMTPREAGQLGAAARPRRLVVTHYSDEVDRDWVASEAAGGYGGTVELAHEGAVYPL